jgi:hypothetical protein
LEYGDETLLIFVGGLGGAGKEAVMELLVEIGFNPGRPGMISRSFNIPTLGRGYVQVITGKMDPDGLRELVLKIAGANGRRIALKTGISMFVSKQLRMAFPKSKFVLCVRHPVNHISLTREYDPETLEHVGMKGLYRKATTLERAEFWAESYRIAMKELPMHYGEDLLIIKLEDMWSETVKTIQRLFDFVGADEEAQEVSGIIKKPKDHDIGYRKLTDLECRQGYRHLTGEERDRVHEITGYMRLEFGYA